MSENLREQPEENFSRESFDFESAHAEVKVYHEDKLIWIDDVYSSDKGEGHGSALLDELKNKYPNYKIEGVAHPTEFEQAGGPSEEEMLRAYDLGYDFKKDKLCDVGFELTPEEEQFVESVRERYKKSIESPFIKVMHFYKQNGFKVDFSTGQFKYSPSSK